MGYFAKDIINDISSQVSINNYPKIYIGITKNIESRLFGDHNVSKGGRQYLYYQAVDESNARFVEEYFIKKGMQGGDGGGSGDGSAIYVYCYVITPYTRQ